MSEKQGLTRREAVTAAAALLLPHPLWAEDEKKAAPLALPGPYRGRVIEVLHPGSVVEGKVRREAVRGMMQRGLVALTGAPDEAAAWKRFFGPGDVVGIKVCPVGRPRSISQPETVLEVIRGLNLAGVPNRDIILFNRYENELMACGYDRYLPQGVRIRYASSDYDRFQTDIRGYDPQAFAEMPRVHPGLAPDEPRNRRSYLCQIVSQQVNKVVNLCVLKDHASAGITMALKNLSHGLVNNVSRSHSSHSDNWCDTFIPTVVRMTPIRQKVVLHIGDGLIATYDGGPGSWNPHFRTWEYRSLFFATDPVAMDRVGWAILDRKRAAEGLPPLAKTGIRAENPGFEQFDHRQPEHVLLAAKMGLGEADLNKIEHRKIRLGDCTPLSPPFSASASPDAAIVPATKPYRRRHPATRCLPPLCLKTSPRAPG
jgi:hypothetical protein